MKIGICLNDNLAGRLCEIIANQLKEDYEYDQMTLNEYIDPFTGEPVQKSRK